MNKKMLLMIAIVVGIGTGVYAQTPDDVVDVMAPYRRPQPQFQKLLPEAIKPPLFDPLIFEVGMKIQLQGFWIYTPLDSLGFPTKPVEEVDTASYQVKVTSVEFFQIPQGQYFRVVAKGTEGTFTFLVGCAEWKGFVFWSPKTSWEERTGKKTKRDPLYVTISDEGKPEFVGVADDQQVSFYKHLVEYGQVYEIYVWNGIPRLRHLISFSGTQGLMVRRK